jgi:4-hydroxy-3-polyprenylbenzoate decarboxylase
MPFDDNRKFVETLEKTGDAIRIQKEVDWDLEAAAVTGRSCELGGPACLFERLKYYPGGGRILGAPMATYRRLAIALDMAPDSPTGAIFDEYERRVSKPLKPVVVRDAPCKENKMFGKDVDLYSFPVPTVHEGNGGRYIGTWHCVISRHPETGWTNWGMYRLMVHNRNTISGYLRPYSQFGLMMEIFERQNLPMPVAVAIGPDPLCALVAASPFRIGEDEVDFAGALRRKPVELVKAETNDLLVPAHAEIILEGEILPKMRLHEGPFGEFPGYRTQGASFQPVFKVKAITYRSNPIICMSPEGVGISDGKIGPSLAGAIGMKERLQRHGVPVINVYIPPEAGALVAVVSVKESDPAMAQKIASVLHGRRVAVPKIIIVNADIDVFNLSEVMHAIGTRLHPVRGITSDPNRQGWTLVPYLSPEERSNDKLATAVFDCTWPAHWSRESDIPVRMSFKTSYPQDLQQKVIEQWQEYGFKT